MSRLRPNDIIFMSLLKPDINTIFYFDMKKLNATSNPFEAEPTTEAFGALDDMAWLNGLQVKSCSRDCDIIRRRRTRTPRVLGRTDRQWNAFFRKVRTESRTENTDKIRKVDIDRHRQEFSGNLDKNETTAGYG